ncbi:MAG: peroxiredoxin [Candidatus Saccharibacteria bacterium]|nr:peroxiredoxin [Pseudorhodobacter sp.]
MLGTAAPDFTLGRDGGTQVTLSALRPVPVVIFAYGADGTPSCTNEVMDFNALMPEFAALGVTVLGLSKDSVAKHDKFIAKMGIVMPLLSDKDGHMMEDWGAFGEKLFFGKQVQGVLRQTFLIDSVGVIEKIWQVDRVKGHAAEVLAYLKARP